jgi:hypothetical protein
VAHRSASAPPLTEFRNRWQSRLPRGSAKIKDNDSPMATAYIETTIPSYYTARNARSILQAGRQIATREWWDGGCSGFDLVTSTETLNEASEGDPEMAKDRLRLLQGMRVLPVTREAADLARLLVASGLVPEIASPDAVHIALASVYRIDFLVTWNFKHIANPHIRERMRTKINESGHWMPVMCSPEELLTEDEAD